MITIPPGAEENAAPTPLGSPALPEPDSTSTLTPSTTDARKERMPLVWIPATLCIGLLIAAVYLGGRIVTAHSSASAQVKTKPTVTHAAPVAPAAVMQAKAEPKPEAPSPQAKPTPDELKPEEPKAQEAKAEAPKPVKSEAPRQAKFEVPKPVAGEPVPMIAPKDGERYIQVGALDLERTRRYIGHLRESKLEPHVAPGPTPEMLRVLIGPFTDRDSLGSTKSQLDSAGIPNFIREY
jgi:cell division septation protein DedD